MKKIITIGRQFGSGGREVGQKVAQALHIAYYDKELLMVAAKKSGLSSQFMNTYDEKPTRSFLYSLVMGQRGLFPDGGEVTVEQLAANAQRDAILSVAGEGGCVIVGRCADYVLRDEPELLRVFLTADRDDRIQRVCRRDGVTAAEAAEKLERMDRSRAAYYRARCDQVWGAAANYDLCINVSRWGVDAAVETTAARCSRP